MVKLVIWDAIAPIMTSLYWQWIIVRVTNWAITSPWSTVTSMPVSLRTLTHWPLGDFDKDLVVFNFILAIDGCDISHEISSRWMSLDITDDKSKLVQVMAWCRQATNHYLSQCWFRSLSDLTWASWRFKSPDIGLFVQQLVPNNNKGIIKALYYWFFVDNIPVTDEFHLQRTRKAESVSAS